MGNLASTVSPVLEPATGTLDNAGAGTGTGTSSSNVCLPQGVLCALSEPVLVSFTAPCCAGLACYSISTGAGGQVGRCASSPNHPVLLPVITTAISKAASATGIVGVLGGNGVGQVKRDDNIGNIMGENGNDGVLEGKGFDSVLDKGGIDNILGDDGIDRVLDGSGSTSVLGGDRADGLLEDTDVSNILSSIGVDNLFLLPTQSTYVETTLSTSYYALIPTGRQPG